jgi:hypothetical protein
MRARRMSNAQRNYNQPAFRGPEICGVAAEADAGERDFTPRTIGNCLRHLEIKPSKRSLISSSFIKCRGFADIDQFINFPEPPKITSRGGNSCGPATVARTRRLVQAAKCCCAADRAPAQNNALPRSSTIRRSCRSPAVRDKKRVSNAWLRDRARREGIKTRSSTAFTGKPQLKSAGKFER